MNKENKEATSKCCNAPTKPDWGAPDFVGDKHGCTCNMVCTKCGKACDINNEEEES